MKKIHTMIILCVFLALNFCLSDDNDIAKSTLTQPGQKVPYFRIKTIQDEIIDINQQQGKVILLNFFATWCQPCQEELPYLQQFSEQHNGKDFFLLSIGREHNKKEIEEFIRKNGFTYRFAADPDRKIYQKFATQYIPRTYLIDQNGIIVKQAVGFNLNEFQEILNELNKLLHK